MKKYLASIAIISIIAACGGGGTETKGGDSATGSSTGTENTAPAATDVTANPDYKAGLALIGKNDCLGCHKTTEKLTGPAYVDVAKKYAGVDTAIAYLSKKIMAGGSGVWGTIPMAGHPQLSQADAEQMVKYILLLKDMQ